MRINVSSLLKRTHFSSSPRDDVGSCFSFSSFLSFRSGFASLAGRSSSSSSSSSSSNGKINGGCANSWRTSDGRRTTAARTAALCSSYSTNASSSLTSSSSQSSWLLPIVGTVGLTFGCVTLGMEYQKRTEKASREALGGGTTSTSTNKGEKFVNHTREKNRKKKIQKYALFVNSFPHTIIGDDGERGIIIGQRGG